MAMTPDTIGVLEGRELEMVAEVFAAAVREGRKLRVCVDAGVKIDAGGITGGWTPPFGRLGDVTGR